MTTTIEYYATTVLSMTSLCHYQFLIILIFLRKELKKIVCDMLIGKSSFCRMIYQACLLNLLFVFEIFKYIQEIRNIFLNIHKGTQNFCT